MQQGASILEHFSFAGNDNIKKNMACMDLKGNQDSETSKRREEGPKLYKQRALKVYWTLGMSILAFQQMSLELAIQEADIC